MNLCIILAYYQDLIKLYREFYLIFSAVFVLNVYESNIASIQTICNFCCQNTS